MLYRFIFKNFKSFKEMNEFSMIPEDNNRHASYIDSDIPVLHETVIFGANASGKSNLIKAVKFLKDLIVKPGVLSRANQNMFILNKKSIDSPSLFLIEIRMEEGFYQYAILANLKDNIILAESLKEYVESVEGQWKSLFYKEFDEMRKFNIIGMTNDSDSENTSRYEVYSQEMEKVTHRTLLAELAGKELRGDHFIEMVNRVYSWFQ